MKKITCEYNVIQGNLIEKMIIAVVFVIFKAIQRSLKFHGQGI